MIAVEFFRLIWARLGIYVIVTGPHPVEGAPGRTYLRPRPFESIEDAAAYCMKMCGEFNVYFAVHSFARYHQEVNKNGKTWDKIARTQANAAYVRALYLDLDVGPGADKYATQADALTDLIAFTKAVGLPRPLVVSSGRGLHVYWPFTEDVSSAEWQPVAELLKCVAAALGLKADPAVTADAARILRPVGTSNLKDPVDPLRVELWGRAALPTPFSTLAVILQRAGAGVPSSGLPTGFRAPSASPVTAAPPSETPENVEKVRGMLAVLSPDMGRDDWLKVVWGVASLGWSCGEKLARGWSAPGATFTEGAFAIMWSSFDPGRAGGVTWRTLQHLAIAAGYNGPNLTEADLPAPAAPVGAGGLPSAVDGTSEADIANGERLAAAASGRLLWVREPNEWVRFSTEAGYLSMPRDEVEGFAIGVVKAMRREAGAMHDADPHSPATKQALQNSKRASARPNMLAMIDTAKAVPGMAVSLAEFDADPMTLGVRNGVLELRKGVLRPFTPSLLVSKRAAVTFDPAARCPLWDAFLARALPNGQVRAFLRRWAGYCLTGDVGAHKWVFLFGSGANGKSVFTETLAHLLGDYALPLAAEVLMDDPRGGRNHDPDIMALQGRRLAFASETEEGQRLAAARVKRLTGGDTLSGRRPYSKAPESFDPTHKLMVSGNHRPAIPDTSPGTWRRVAIVEFGVEIPASERDASLPAKLRQEAPGILNWALAGLADYKVHGLQLPAAVTAATDEYQRDEDVFGQFLAERCELGDGPAFKVPEANLYDAFGAWCSSIGRQKVPTKTMLTRQIKGRRVTLDRNAKAYTGVRLT